MIKQPKENSNNFIDPSWAHYQLLTIAGQVVSAYIQQNTVDRSEITALVQEVYAGLGSVRGPASARLVGSLMPAVPIQDSVTDDHIVCLEDGKKLKMIKRHLKAMYNMTVEEYRQKWGLPMDYPSVAPNYAKKRSSLAKVIGLGMNGRRKKAS